MRTWTWIADGRKGVRWQGRQMSGSWTAERRHDCRDTLVLDALDRAMTAEMIIDSSRSLQKSPYGQVDKKKGAE